MIPTFFYCGIIISRKDKDMQREHFLKIFVKGLGYALFGNILSGIMVFSITPVINVWLLTAVALLFTLFIYGSLLFTAGYRDGQRENKLITNRRVESSPKYRWLIFGLIIGLVMAIPSFIILAAKFGMFGVTQEFMFAFRFISGAVTPLLYASGMQSAAVADYPLWLCIAFAGIYVVLSPLCAHIGYKFGFDDKKRTSFMYEEQ